MNNEKLVEQQDAMPITPVSRFVLRFLQFSIHAAHAVWIVALIVSVAKDGAISSYRLFMPLLILAFCLEMCRWALLGRKTVEVKGAYSHASAIENTNREFLLFSWYIVPVLLPFKLMELYAAGNTECLKSKIKSQIFSKFWLKSEMTLPLMSCLLLVYGFYLGTPPALYGFHKYYSIVCLYWIISFGLFSKLISVFLFSTFIRIFKGF